MPHPDRIIVHAIIPHQDDPELHIVDGQGNYPSRVHEAGRETLEGTLRSIGQDVISRTLSVDTRCVDQEVEGTVVYLAKPPSHPLNPHNNYRWMRRSV